MSVPVSLSRGSRFASAVLAVAFAAAIVLLAATARPADASFAITDFKLTPSTTQAGGHPNTHYHVDPDAPLADRTNGDDLKRVVIDFPAGLLGNPEAATTKCSAAQFSGDTCPSASYIGSMSVKWREKSWITSKTFSAPGSVYVLTPATPGSAVTVGFILRPSGYRKVYLKTEVSGVVTVRSGVDADYGLTLVVDNIPRTMTTSGGSTKNITFNDITVDINARANTAKTGPYFAFNPTRCTVANTRATITSYTGVIVTKNTSFTPTACASVPFAPTASVTPTNPMPGATTGVSATFTVPTADATIQNSNVSGIQADLPVGTGLDFPTISAVPALCTDAQLNADTCQAGSKIGNVSAAVPFLPPTMTGDVYLMQRGNSIVFGYVLRGANGVKAMMKGNAGVVDVDNDGAADLVRATTGNMPQAPWSTATINFTTAMVKNPTSCGATTATTKVNGWSGASVTSTKPWGPGGDCDTPPVVNIVSPAPGSFTNASTIALIYMATDNSGVAPTCTYPNGTVFHLVAGFNTLTVTCTDQNGNSTSATTNVTRDSVAPVVTITSPPPGYVTSAATVTLTYTVTEQTPYTCNIPSGSSVALSAGTSYITVSCTDSAGNAGSASVTINRPQSPQVFITAPVNGSVTSNSTTTLQYTLLDQYGGATCNLANGATIPLVIGANTIAVVCTNIYGMAAAATVSVTRSIDVETRPLVDITSPANGLVTTASSITVNYNVTYYGGRAGSCTIANGASVALSVGSNSIVVTCADSAGDVGIDVVTVQRETFAPTYNQTIGNPVAGANTPFSFVIDSDGANASGVRSANITIGAEISPDFSAFGNPSADLCPSTSVTTPGGGAPATYDPAQCPAQAKVGTAVFTSASGGSIPGDVHMINRAPVPWIGVSLANGSRFVFLITVVQVDPLCDSTTETCEQTLRFSVNGLPSASDSSLAVTLDGPPRMAANGSVLSGQIFKLATANDPVCDGTISSSATMSPWATGSPVTDTDSDVIDCSAPDVTPPTVNITSPVDGSDAQIGSSVTLRYTATDDGGGPVTCNRPDGQSITIVAGFNTIVVTCTDSAGNASSDTVVVAGAIYEPPFIVITSPAQNLYTQQSSVTLSYAVYTSDGVPATCDKADGSSVPLNPGANNVSVTCSDSLFHMTTTASRTVYRDNIAPEIRNLNCPVGPGSTSCVIDYIAVDNLDPSPVCTPADGSTVPLQAGSNTITVTCVDDAGNVGTASVTVFRSGGTPLSVDITNCTLTGGSSVTCTYTVSGGSPPYTCVSGPCNGPSVYPTPPSSVTICIQDSAGNTACDTWMFPPISPPGTSITAFANPSAGQPSSGPASALLSVSFSGSGSPTSFECRVDTVAWSACASPWTVPTTGLTGPAEHSYEVRATNGAGPDATPAKGYFWYDGRVYSTTPSATAGVNSLEPTAADANDAGAHPDVSLALNVEGYDDTQSTSVIAPDGFMLSPRSIPENSRCTAAQAGAGTCPASSQIGTASLAATSSTDGAFTATGNVYLVGAAGLAATDLAGLAIEFENISGPVTGSLGNVIVQAALRQSDNGRNTRIEVTSMPRQSSSGRRFHLRSVGMTLDGDTRPDTGAPASATNPAFVTNQHICAVIGTSRPRFNQFYGWSTGYSGSVIPAAQPFSTAYPVDNCTGVPFNPAVNFAVDNRNAGESGPVHMTLTAPYDHSPVRSMTATLPPWLGPNFAAFGASSDMCSPTVAKNASPAGTTPTYLYFDYKDSANPCPQLAKIGTVDIDSPLYGTLKGDVWLIDKSPTPWFGIRVSPEVDAGNPQGVEFGLVATTSLVTLPAGCIVGVDAECFDYMRIHAASNPDVPVNSMSVHVGTIAGRAGQGSVTSNHAFKNSQPGDSSCVNGGQFSTSLTSWSGTTVTRTQPMDPICPQPDQPPTITITSPVNNSQTQASTATLLYVATDDSGVAPTCNIASGTVVPLVSGPNTITVTCTDNIGQSATRSVVVIRDNQAPTISNLSCGTSPTTLPSCTLTYTKSDNITPAGSVTCTPANGTTIPLTIGMNTITVTCADAAGNSSVATITVQRVTNPVVTANCTFTGGTINCTFSGSGGVPPYSFTCSLDGAPAAACSSPFSVATFAGSHVVTICLIDAIGSTSCINIAVSGGAIPPETTMLRRIPPSAALTGSGAADFAVSAGATAQCRVDGDAWQPCVSPWSVPLAGLTSPAEHMYEVRAVDSGGVDATPVRGYVWVDDRTWTAVPTVAAMPNSLEPTAAEANDAGAHPNVTAMLSLQGYDDPQTATVVGPDGMMGSLKSIPAGSRCTMDDADAGDCPVSSQIGTAVATATSATDGTVTANGAIYLVDPTGLASTDAAGVAIEFENITGPVTGNLGNVIARGGLRINDQGRNVKLVADNIPRETTNGVRFHLRSGSVTINGDKRPDMSSPPSESNPALITNPHICTTIGTARPRYNQFYGWGSGWGGSQILESAPISAMYVVDNCAAVPFNPTVAYTVDNRNAGEAGPVHVAMDLPYDHSPVRSLVSTLPPWISANTQAFGASGDMCSPAMAKNASPAGTNPGYLYFDYNDSSLTCPSLAKIGTAEVTTPLLDGTVKADVWLIDKSPVPWLGIRVSPAVDPGNPQGVELGFVITTTVVSQPAGCIVGVDDPCYDYLRATASALPDVPVSSIDMHLGTIPGRDGQGSVTSDFPVKNAQPGDSSCQTGFSVSTTLTPWRGTPTAVRTQPLDPIGCTYTP